MLLLLFEKNDEPWLIFTKRSQNVRTHKGEISFPGGAVDPGESARQAAVREVFEELGIEPADVSVIGELSELPTFVTGFVVKPFVALVPEAEAYAHSEAEVEEVLRIPLAVLAEIGREAEWEVRGYRFTTNLFEVDGNVIWGATGRILRDFLDVVAPALGLTWKPGQARAEPQSQG